MSIPGNIVPANGTTGLCVITQLQPITVIFTIAEDDLDRGDGADGDRPHAAGRSPSTGRSSIKSPAAPCSRSTTRSTRPRARCGRGRRFANRKNELFPNQFVNARLLVKTLTKVNLVPQAAIQRNNDAAFVYVVQPDSTVQSRDVKIFGDRRRRRPPSPGSSAGEQARDRRLRQAAERLEDRHRKPGAGSGASAGGGERTARSRPDESVPPVHPAADRNLAVDGGDPAGRHHRLSAAADRGAARGGLSDDAGARPSIPGRAPTSSRSAVTAPLERQLGEVPGLNQMLSTSSEGASVITLQFALSLNIDVAEQDVQEAINAAQNFLPAQLPMPPVYNKVNPADAPILTLALTSDSIPLSQGRGLHRHAPGGEDLAAARSRRRDDQRRPEAGGAHPGESDAARLLRPQSRGCAHRADSRPASTRPRAASTARPRATRSAPTTRSRPARTTGSSSWPTGTARRSC